VAGCITVKIRYSDFQTITKQAMISYTGSDHTLLKKAKELFYKLYDRRLLVRLLGIRLTHIIPGNHQINLFDDTEEMLQLYKAIDSVKHQFGESVLKRAAAIHKSEKTVPLKPK
jgi:DNA polymerase-4